MLDPLIIWYSVFLNCSLFIDMDGWMLYVVHLFRIGGNGSW